MLVRYRGCCDDYWNSSAARGCFPVNLTHPDELAESVAFIGQERAAAGRTMDGYDVAVELPAGTDPAPYAAAGATWWMAAFPCESVTVDAVRGVLRDGPTR